MARSIGKLTLSFGLVSIPTKVYSTGDAASRIAFNLLSPKGNRLKQQYIDPTDGTIVPHAEQLKGYEFAKGQYVTFTQDELKAIQEPKDPVAAIASFVPDRIPIVNSETCYYLVPEKGAERAYELLRAAMLRGSRVALTKHCTRGKQHLACIRATERGLILHHLKYADEVVQFEDVYAPAPVRVTDAELAMAQRLIEACSTDQLDLSCHTDSVRERLQAAIDAKVAGQELPATDNDAPRPATMDLMEALKRSLGEAA
jgi:DNA end-binding protein Ku